MKKIWVLWLALLLCGCANGSDSPYTDEQLMEICNDVDTIADSQIDGMEYKEIYGSSDSEKEQQEYFYKIYNRLRDRAVKKYKIKVNSPIVVTGQISGIETLRDGEIHIYLGDIKNKQKVLPYPVICSTYDEAFLELQEGDSITIEGIFFKKDRKEEHISDCTLR